MNITYVCTDLGIMMTEIKGAAIHVRSVIEAFGRQGHRVRLVASPGNEYRESHVPVTIIPPADFSGELDGRKHPRMMRALRHVWNNVHAADVIQQVITDERPDLIYERYSPFSVAAAAVAARAGIPHVLEVNAQLAWEGKEYRKQALQEAAEYLEEAVFDLSSQIVTVSEDLKCQLVGAGVDEKKILVVPNGVDVGSFTTAGSKARVAPEDAFVIGFVGTLRPWHGVEVLLDAFRDLSVDERYHLVIIGKGQLTKAVEGLSQELPGRVTQIGEIDHAEVPAYLRGLDVAVAPYPQLDRFYFSPLKILEYMACGIPTVASRIGQVESLIHDKENGLLVPPGDQHALAEAIRCLAHDPAYRESLGARAAQEAQASHSWDARVDAILGSLPVPA